MVSKKIDISVKTDCPVCNSKGSLEVVQISDNIPYFGDILETFGKCSKCSYQSGDLIFVDDTKLCDTKQEIKIHKPEHLSLRVVKSNKCRISIPEIKLTIDPGAFSEGFVTNVEGLIERITNNVKRFAAVHPEKLKEVEEVVLKLEKMKNGKKKFTILFEDESGRSMILKDDLEHK